MPRQFTAASTVRRTIGEPVHALFAGTVAIVVALSSACAPAITIGVNTAPDLRTAAYRTFTWELPDQFPTGDPRLDNNPFFVRELQNAVSVELGELGLREGNASSDLTVHFHATVQNRVDVFEADRAAGYDVSGYGTATQVMQYEEGTVLVDVAERTTKKLLWRGWMQTDLSGTIGNNAALGERVRRGMAKLFERFPSSIIANGSH